MNEQIQEAAKKILEAINNASHQDLSTFAPGYADTLVTLKKLDLLINLGTGLEAFGTQFADQLPDILTEIKRQLS